MSNSRITAKKVLGALGWIAIAISVIFLIFGFGEDGFEILKATEFWVVVDSLWILAILLFVIEGRLK